MNNTLLEMLLNATTGNLPAGSVTALPRWTGPDPVVVQVQCIFYATICATLLASFLAMLGKQWLNRYRQNETRGSTADRSRMREKKLTGIETWKFHIIMEALPLILQSALVLLGFGLSRYLWEVNRSVSSVVIGFTAFGLLFYALIVTVSIFSFVCPYQTPFSLIIRFFVRLAFPHWRSLRQSFGPKKRPHKSGTPGPGQGLPSSANNSDRDQDLEANPTRHEIALVAIPPSELVAPLFFQEVGAEVDRLDAKCVDRMFVMSTGSDVVVSIMDFIPEIIWHSGIKEIPFKRIYDTLMDCFDASGSHPMVIPKMRDIAYLSARAFAHVALQRRCITRCEDHKQDSWKVLRENHRFLSLTNYGADSDLETVLFMVDTTLGYDDGFFWGQKQMSPAHRAWMSHVFLYRAWNEGQSLSEDVMGFVENSMSQKWPSDAVVTDCLYIIGLMVGVPFHINDITVRDKRLDLNSFRVPFTDPAHSRQKQSVFTKVFGALSTIFSSKSIPPLATRALQLATQLETIEFAGASYELFKVIMAPEDMTEEYWEAARHTMRGAFQRSIGGMASLPAVGNPKEILKFLDYHLDRQGAGEDHTTFIFYAFDAILVLLPGGRLMPLVAEGIKNFNCASSSFVRGMRSIISPTSNAWTREFAMRFMPHIHVQWFCSPVPVMEPEDMTEFSEHIAMLIVDAGPTAYPTTKQFFPSLFSMLRSQEWRQHMVTRLWSLLAHWTLADEEEESFKWCLKNAVELLEFTKGLSDGERFKWWYGTLWFHFEKLDPTVRSEVERIAVEMSSGDGLSDLDLYLSIIGQEVDRTRRKLEELTEEARVARSGMALGARFVTLEGNHRRLARITGRR